MQVFIEAIKKRFGGNEATKKTQKTLLKQMYETFNASSSESLDSIFNRLQKISSSIKIQMQEEYLIQRSSQTGEDGKINMLVEKKYPLKKEILEKMINLKIEAEEESSVVATENTGSNVVGMENEDSDGDGTVNGGVGYGEVIVKV
ncbi:hypothetical protein Tco_1079180 [Tanacetum coccineum]|uniref:Uncharacterized protein n=1 Tax=Tanacetum coccineum TaxID=301880 RepID=A0ABQ5HRJ1_9ASTR